MIDMIIWDKEHGDMNIYANDQTRAKVQAVLDGQYQISDVKRDDGDSHLFILNTGFNPYGLALRIETIVK